MEDKDQGILAQQKLLHALEESPKWPDDWSEDQKQELLEMETSIIILHLSDVVIRMIDKEDTPAKIWNKLDELFEKKILDKQNLS